MSNNKQSIKIYTEEQVRRAINLALDSPTHANLVIDHLTPIELPSDEDEEKAAFTLTKNLQQHMGFNIGAKWMRDKIGGNK